MPHVDGFLDHNTSKDNGFRCSYFAYQSRFAVLGMLAMLGIVRVNP